MKLALFSGEYPIDSGLGGIGLRLWELAQVLVRTFDIRIIVPRQTDFSFNKIKFALKEEAQDSLEWCDIALFSDMPDPHLLLTAHQLNKLIICDNAVPIEHIYYGETKNAPYPEEAYRLLVKIFELQVLVSDVFLTRAPVERATLLSTLVLLGRFNYPNFSLSKTLDHMIFSVPIGFNLASKKHAKIYSSSKEVDYTWSGGVWDFYDAATAVKAISFSSKKNKKITLKFLYPFSNDPSLKEQQLVKKLISELNIADLVKVPTQSLGHSERDPIMQSTHALISLSKPGIENETCHRLRLRDTFLYELPIIVDKHGETGYFVHNSKIGLSLDTTDPYVIAYEMERLLFDKELYAHFRENIRIHQEKVLYENSLITVQKRLKEGTRSADRHIPEIEAQITSLSHIISHLKHIQLKTGV